MMTEQMISFIVIGKDEGWKLSLCFKSILNCISENQIERYEIIYVDSCSSDSSIEKAKIDLDLKIFSITGNYNAAIARNIGAMEATGDILFFLDGDMELQADFINHLFNDKKKLIYPFVSGIMCHYYYDKNWVYVDNQKTLNIPKNVFRNNAGGFFIITKQLWTEVGGMDVRFKANEDFDFGLRMSKKGIHLLLINELAVNHHTIKYTDSTRIWKQLLLHRFRALLVRRHLFTNKYYVSSFFRMNYSAVVLFFALLFSFVSIWVMMGYLLVIVIRSMKHGMLQNFELLPFFLLRDMLFLCSLFFYYPLSLKVEYKQIPTYCQ